MPNLKKHITYHHCISRDETSLRIDQLLSSLLNDFSRSQIQNWIKSGNICVDGVVCRVPKTKLHADQTISLDAYLEDHSSAQAEAIELDKIYEDDHILLINKPAGLVVHPGAGNTRGTLMNALLYDNPNLNVLPRAGIVHRLDKDTTGIMVIAKSFNAYHTLTEDLANRLVKRQYLAIVDGNLKSGCTIDQPIGRHSTARQKMAVHPNGKHATTHVHLLKRLQGYTLTQIDLDTGRTHQIRVHMHHIGHPLLGDSTYGKHRGYHRLDAPLAQVVLSFKRQALHAHHLAFKHPVDGHLCQFTAPIPIDMQQLIQALSPSEDATA